MDSLDKVLARFNQGMDAIPRMPVDPEAEAAEQVAHGLRTFRDRIRILAVYAVQEDSGSLKALFLAGLLNGIPEGVDEDAIHVLLDMLERSEMDGKIFLDFAKEVHLVEICLPNLRADFNRGLREIHADRNVYPQPKGLTFEQIEDSLLSKNAFGLRKAAAMQGGGELFGLDENGKFLFKDRGNEPVMFGFDRDRAGNLITVYNRDPEQMAQIACFPNYYEIYEAVYGPEDASTGYELFPDAPDGEKRGMIAAVEEITRAAFVRSANGNEWRSSWLDNGRKPEKNADVRNVYLGSNYRSSYIGNSPPSEADFSRGAIRLLRV